MLVDWFCLCKCSGESMDHFAILLCFCLCCGATYFCLFGFDWAMSRRRFNLLVGCRNWFVKHLSDVAFVA